MKKYIFSIVMLLSVIMVNKEINSGCGVPVVQHEPASGVAVLDVKEETSTPSEDDEEEVEIEDGELEGEDEI